MKVWSKEDSIVACALYAVTQYSEIQSKNPQIIKVAEKIGRSPAALVMRMTSFAGLDPVAQARGQKGFDSATKQDKEVWAEFQKDWRGIIARAEAIIGPLEG